MRWISEGISVGRSRPLVMVLYFLRFKTDMCFQLLCLSWDLQPTSQSWISNLSDQSFQDAIIVVPFPEAPPGCASLTPDVHHSFRMCVLEMTLSFLWYPKWSGFSTFFRSHPRFLSCSDDFNARKRRQKHELLARSSTRFSPQWDLQEFVGGTFSTRSTPTDNCGEDF